MIHPESSKSQDARPPIQPEEMAMCDDAICLNHRGLIRQTGAKEGTVFWCPVGRQYWRYKGRERTGFNARLNYPKTGIV